MDVIEDIALYGGAFDPTTNAHEAIAETVHNKTGMPIWMMPCYQHRFGKILTPAEHRLEMIKVISKRLPFIIPCDQEIKTQHDGSMYETLTNLSKIHPDKKFHLIMGMDNANNIHEWHMWEKLIAEFPCFVIKRKGCIASKEWFNKEPHHLIEMDSDLNATSIRSAILCRNYQWARFRLGVDTWNYIVEHQLFGYKPD